MAFSSEAHTSPHAAPSILAPSAGPPKKRNHCGTGKNGAKKVKIAAAGQAQPQASPDSSSTSTQPGRRELPKAGTYLPEP